MKRILITLTLLTAVQLVSAQEQLSREEALKYAFLAAADLKQLQGTPIPTDVDVKRPMALRDGEHAGMILPEAKLKRETIDKATEKAVPLGQLWLLKLTPMKDGEAIPGDQLRLATLKPGDGDVTVVQCALGARRNQSGALEFLVFGKDKEPLLKVPLKQIEAKQELPIEVEAERGSDSAEITLKILGQYEAKFKVTELQL